MDEGHVFEVGKPTRVCGNTAAMVGEGGLSWLTPHFDVFGNRDSHFGVYPGCSGRTLEEIATASSADKSKYMGGAAPCC